MELLAVGSCDPLCFSDVTYNVSHFSFVISLIWVLYLMASLANLFCFTILSSQRTSPSFVNLLYFSCLLLISALIFIFFSFLLLMLGSICFTSPIISVFIYWLFRRMLFSFHVFMSFPVFLVLIFSFMPHDQRRY